MLNDQPLPLPLSEFAFGRHGELTRIAGVHCPPALGLGLANIHLWRLETAGEGQSGPIFVSAAAAAVLH